MRTPRTVSAHRRHKKILKRTRGYRGGRHSVYKQAHNAYMRAGIHAYVDRRRKKRDFRHLWITRINAACREEGIAYSRFMKGLLEAQVQLNRKILADLAVHNKDVFKQIVAVAKKALASYVPVAISEKELAQFMAGKASLM